jgi:N6-L-threonylcarbamoyladenine synthase
MTITILGIESSCDETSCAIVDENGTINSNIVWSQRIHEEYGGVVPEISARSHLASMPRVIQKALDESGLSWNEIDAIACTGGPGLIGGLLVGVMAAKSLAHIHNKPFLPINHLEGHALTARLNPGVEFPFLLLLVSGGHCQLWDVNHLGDYHLLGETMDDAAGEAFDKVAKMLNLPYPGGPSIEKIASTGNSQRFKLPIPLQGQQKCDFSFSGLKTAVRQLIEKNQPLTDQTRADIAASFQYTVIHSLLKTTQRALTLRPHLKRLVVGGGVACNALLRSEFSKMDIQFIAPPLHLCCDNAAMIAWAGVERYKKGLYDQNRNVCMSFRPRPRWIMNDANNYS